MEGLYHIYKKRTMVVFFTMAMFYMLRSSSFSVEVSDEEYQKSQNKVINSKSKAITKAPVTSKIHKKHSRDFAEARRYNRDLVMRNRPRQREDIAWCKPPKFRQVRGPVTALASFPGSGNTWVRYLLQQLTGTLTGSVYYDPHLVRNGFYGENHRGGDVLAVKTHEWGPKVRSKFSWCLLVVRAPLPSILAEYNRQAAGHTGHAKNMKTLNGFVRSKVKSWRNINMDWIENFNPDRLLIVSYSKLLTDLSSQLVRMTTFLNVTVTEDQLQCTLRRSEGAFKRKKREQKLLIDKSTRDLLEEYKMEVMKAAVKVDRSFVFDIENNIYNKEYTSKEHASDEITEETMLDRQQKKEKE